MPTEKNIGVSHNPALAVALGPLLIFQFYFNRKEYFNRGVYGKKMMKKNMTMTAIDGELRG